MSRGSTEASSGSLVLTYPASGSEFYFRASTITSGDKIDYMHEFLTGLTIDVVVADDRFATVEVGADISKSKGCSNDRSAMG